MEIGHCLENSQQCAYFSCFVAQIFGLLYSKVMINNKVAINNEVTNIYT